MSRKRVMAVIEFEDAEGSIGDVVDAATWLEAEIKSLRASVTVYGSADDLRADAAERAGAFESAAVLVS